MDFLQLLYPTLTAAHPVVIPANCLGVGWGRFRRPAGTRSVLPGPPNCQDVQPSCHHGTPYYAAESSLAHNLQPSPLLLHIKSSLLLTAPYHPQYPPPPSSRVNVNSVVDIFGRLLLEIKTILFGIFKQFLFKIFLLPTLTKGSDRVLGSI